MRNSAGAMTVHRGMGRSPWVVLSFAAVLGCHAAASQEVAAPTSSVTAPELAFFGETTCNRVVPYAPGAMQDDAQALCRATSYDLDRCGTGGAREGFECLVAAGAPAQLFVELARAEQPAVRSYGREGLERLGAWTPDLLREALADGATVEQDSDCGGAAFPAWRLGVFAILQSNEALAAVLLPQLLMTTTDPELAASLLFFAGAAPWMDARALGRVATYPGFDTRLQAHAQWLLSQRDSAPPEPNETWGRDGACHRRLDLELLYLDAQPPVSARSTTTGR